MELTEEWPAVRRERVWYQSLGRLLRNRGASAGLAIAVALAIVAIAAPALTAYDPNRISLGDVLQSPSRSHPMGTDEQGRDVLSRVMFGARNSLRMGLVSVAIAAFSGTLLGLISGYFGGALDQAIMSVMDVMLAFPGILLAMSIVAILGPGLSNAMIAVGISWVPSYTRLVRGSTLSARQNEYVMAAQALGCRTHRILLRHILPNVVAPVIVLASMGVAGAIVVGASLSFLGLGAQPPTPEWGSMLNTGRSYMRSAWWLMTFPGLAIVISVMAMNLLGDGLREILDPRLRL